MTAQRPDICDTPGEGQDNNTLAAPDVDAIRAQVTICLNDLQEAAELGEGHVLVIGASSSEVVGQRIGTATSMAVGKAIVDAVESFCAKVGCTAVYQCCEHLNRALVTTHALTALRGWQQVSAIPVPGAGGAVAASAYQTLQNACLVERVEADAGIDIGDTLIGMHLRRIAVPVRGSLRQVGDAHVLMARSRPPLIGGTRAVYTQEEAAKRL